MEQLNVEPGDLEDCAELVGPVEIAERLGVKHRTVAVWRQRARNSPDERSFPEPVRRISRTPVWEWEAVRQWAEETGRLEKRP